MKQQTKEEFVALAQGIVEELSSLVGLSQAPVVRLAQPGEGSATAVAVMNRFADEIWIADHTRDWPETWLRGVLAHEVGHFVSALPRRHLVVGFYPALGLASFSALFIRRRWAVLLPAAVNLISCWALWLRRVEEEKSADITASHIEPGYPEYREASWKRGKWPSRKAQLLSFAGPHQSRRRRYRNAVHHAGRTNCGCPSAVAPRWSERVRIAVRASRGKV